MFSLFLVFSWMFALSSAASTQESITDLQKEMNLLKNELKLLNGKVNNLEEENRSLKKNFNNKRFVLGSNSRAERPAFSAGLGNHATQLGKSQTIIFENVFTNDLQAYSPLTGVFTAPFNGTYFFTATVMSLYNEYVETEICLNGQPLVYMFSKDADHEQGTNSVVLVLQTGDKVWVRHHVTEGSNVHGYNWSSFTGFMLA